MCVDMVMWDGHVYEMMMGWREGIVLIVIVERVNVILFALFT